MNVQSAYEFVTQGFTSGRVRSLANTLERLAKGYPVRDPQHNVNLQNARTLRQRAREMDKLKLGGNFAYTIAHALGHEETKVS